MTEAIAKTLITLAVASTLASSQALTGIRAVAPASSHETTAVRHLEAARPLLGYVTGGSHALRSVVGSADNPQWGEPLSLPDSTTVAFLPPRQEYVLLASEAGLSVARLSRTTVYPGTLIPNAISQPDRVSFSPSGEAAALFSSAESRIEVLTYIAAQVRVRSSVPVANPDELLQFTVSDDGELVVATFANQPPVYSWRGAMWQPLSTSYRPDAWTFLPRSHNLVLSDRTEKAIVVLPESEKAPIAARVLTTGNINAGLLSADKQGNQLLAVAAGSSASWSINLASGVIAPLLSKGNNDSLTLLRDGHTFLVSMKDSPVIVKLSADAVQSAATNNFR